MFLAEHFTAKFRLLILVVPCCIDASWLPIVLNLLEGIPHQHPNIKYLFRDVSVSSVLKGLHLILWLLKRYVSHTQELLSSVKQWWGWLRVFATRVYQQFWKDGQVDVLEWMYRTVISAPKLATLLFRLFEVGLAWHTVGICLSPLQPFWNLIIIARLKTAISSLSYCVILFIASFFM